MGMDKVLHAAECTDKDKCRGRFAAIAEKQHEMIRLLLCEGADPNSKWLGSTALLMAIGMDDKEAVQILLKDRRTDVNLPASTGIFPLFLAAAKGNVLYMRLLRARGANVDQKFRVGDPLEGVPVTLQNKIKHVPLRENQDKTALEFAILKNHVDVVAELRASVEVKEDTRRVLK